MLGYASSQLEASFQRGGNENVFNNPAVCPHNNPVKILGVPLRFPGTTVLYL